MKLYNEIGIYALVIGLFILSPLTTSGQDTLNVNNREQTELEYIRWVSEFSSQEKKTSKKGLFYRLGEFVFGKKPAVLIKPIAIVANNPEKYWAIDQKSNTIALIEDQKGITLKSKDRLEETFVSLVDICELPGKGLLISDSRLNQLFLASYDGKKIDALNDSLVLAQPTGIAFSKDTDEIWVLETKLHRIAILNKQGELLRTIGTRGNSTGEFNFPTHIWIDDNGLVYIVDSMNFRVQIFNNQGEFISMFGQAGDASGYFARPKGIATDSHGNIYVVDALFHTVQIFNRTGNLLYSFGNQGHEKGDFWLPLGIYIDSNNYIYVADSYNMRVQVFQLINHD